MKRHKLSKLLQEDLRVYDSRNITRMDLEDYLGEALIMELESDIFMIASKVLCIRLSKCEHCNPEQQSAVDIGLELLTKIRKKESDKRYQDWCKIAELSENEANTIIQLAKSDVGQDNER